MPTKLTTYGPGKRAREHPFPEYQDQTAIVLERNKKTVTHLSLYSGMPMYLHVGRTATLEFDAWHEPTPNVPAIRIIDLFYQHARRLGATPEAVDVLRSVLSNLTDEECKTMVATATAAQEAQAPKRGAPPAPPKATAAKVEKKSAAPAKVEAVKVTPTPPKAPVKAAATKKVEAAPVAAKPVAAKPVAAKPVAAKPAPVAAKAPAKVEAAKPKATEAPKSKLTEVAPGGLKMRNGGINFPASATASALRKGTKNAILLDKIARARGATMEELCAACSKTGTPWTPETTRTGIYYLKNVGYGLQTKISKAGVASFLLVLPEGLDAPVPHK